MVGNWSPPEQNTPTSVALHARTGAFAVDDAVADLYEKAAAGDALAVVVLAFGGRSAERCRDRAGGPRSAGRCTPIAPLPARPPEREFRSGSRVKSGLSGWAGS
jgi:hypothetical protein